MTANYQNGEKNKLSNLWKKNDTLNSFVFRNKQFAEVKFYRMLTLQIWNLTPLNKDFNL